MKQLEGPTVPSTAQTEIIGQQIDLPGRYPILTDGAQFELVKDGRMETVFQMQDDVDRQTLKDVERMVKRVIEHARKKLSADGRTLFDWKYTVMVAVHHKGQATDFWFGDGPEKEVKVDQLLPENLRKPVNAQRVRIDKR